MRSRFSQVYSLKLNRGTREPEINVEKLVRDLLPHMVTAGDYAVQVQSKVQNKPDKEGRTSFSQALTDADVSVQNFMEVLLLAQYPDISFFGEEMDQSLNMKYFPKNSEYKLWLDPVNGTRFYRDGLEIFDIIATVTGPHKVEAVTVYVPRKEIFYLSITGQGAFTTTKEAVLSGAPWAPLQLFRKCRDVMLFDQPEVTEKIDAEFPVIDLYRDYDPSSWSITQHSVLTGGLGAYIGFDVHLIDWGAVGYVAAEAGGVMTDINGEPLESFRSFPDGCIPSLVVAADAKIHGKLLAGLSR